MGARPLPADSLSGLLEPSLQDHAPRGYDGPRWPWRLGSQVYVAILGGPLALTIIAFVNAGRLHMPDRQRTALLAVGVAGMLATIPLLVLVPGEIVLGRIAGALLCGPLYLMQRAYDRVYFVFSPHDDEDEAYESLFGPGFAAVIVGVIAMIAVADA